MSILLPRATAKKIIWKYNENKKGIDFSGGPVVKNLPSIAGEVSLIPGWGTRISHALGQLSPGTTIREAWMLHEEASFCN